MLSGIAFILLTKTMILCLDKNAKFLNLAVFVFVAGKFEICFQINFKNTTNFLNIIFQIPQK